MVSSVTIDNNNIGINNNVTLILSWSEPLSNSIPIVSYTVSCSGDNTCPKSVTTNDNTTTSHFISNLMPMTTYTFSVIATNSICSGQAYAVKFTAPGNFMYMYI